MAEDVHTLVQPEALINPTSSNSQNQVQATAEMEVRQANQNPTKAEIDGAKMKAVNDRMSKVQNDLDLDVHHLNDVAVKKAAAELYKQKVQELYDKESEIDDSIEKFEDEKILLEKVLLLSFSDYREYKDIINEINSYLAYRIPGDTSNHSDTSAMNLQKLTVSTEFVQRTYQRNILHQLVTLDRIYAELKSIDSLYVITTFSTDSLSYTKHKNRLNEFTDESINQFTQAYTIFLQNLSNPNLFVKSYTPRFATADSFRFQISLVPSVRARGLIGLYKIPVRDTAMQPFTLPVKHFLKLNLSTGLAFLFGGAVPNTYFFDTPKDQLTDSQFVSIKRGRRTAVLIPRIALFTHLYLTNGSWGMPALTLGISTNPADPSETAYMMGGSMIMGHHQRMVLTFGAALANIDHLKARYKEEVDKPHLKKYFQNVDEAGLLEKRLQLGLFFGVSYNF